MSIVNHNVVKAHSFARQAEEALENRQWEPAIHLYQQAADLFLLATNDTSDLESIKALQLLSNAQSNKSKALLRHLQHFGARNAETAPPPSVSSERLIVPSEAMEEIALSASESYFLGQAPHSAFSDQLTNREKNQKQTALEKPQEKRSVGTDIWGWMERMLELLVLPDSFKPSNALNYGPRDSSLMSSFYFVPEKEDGFALDGGDRKPARIKDPEVKERDHRVQELERNMARLVDENSELKNKLQEAYTDRVQVSKENDVMKRSIMQFRQEFNKKAHLFRDISSSVGHLPSVSSPLGMGQDYQQQLERTVQQMRVEIMQLQNQVSSLTLKSNRQNLLIEKYEEEIEKYQNAQRKSGQFPFMGSSPPEPTDIASSQTLLSSSENPAPFEPDESLTGSLILQ